MKTSHVIAVLEKFCWAQINSAMKISSVEINKAKHLTLKSSGFSNTIVDYLKDRNARWIFSALKYDVMCSTTNGYLNAVQLKIKENIILQFPTYLKPRQMFRLIILNDETRYWSKSIGVSIYLMKLTAWCDKKWALGSGPVLSALKELSYQMKKKIYN